MAVKADGGHPEAILVQLLDEKVYVEWLRQLLAFEPVHAHANLPLVGLFTYLNEIELARDEITGEKLVLLLKLLPRFVR